MDRYAKIMMLCEKMLGGRARILSLTGNGNKRRVEIFAQDKSLKDVSFKKEFCRTMRQYAVVLGDA